MKRNPILTGLPAIVLVCSLLPTAAQAQFTQQGSKLVGTGTAAAAYQGLSVSFSADGNTAMVGGPLDNGLVGAAWVFTRSAGVWSQQAKLAGTGAIGAARQGGSVSLSGDGSTAIVGAPFDDDSASAAWVATRPGGVRSQQGPKLVGRGAIGAATQSASVSLSGGWNTAIVGRPSDNNYVGAAWVCA